MRQPSFFALLTEISACRADPVLEAQIGEGDARWDHHPAIVDELKAKARKLGLWNMFFPKGQKGTRIHIFMDFMVR